jgi:hypothetical protein
VVVQVAVASMEFIMETAVAAEKSLMLRLQ